MIFQSYRDLNREHAYPSSGSPLLPSHPLYLFGRKRAFAPLKSLAAIPPLTNILPSRSRARIGHENFSLHPIVISQLIRYARACSSYDCFILRARRLSSKLLKQGYLVERLKSSFRKFYGRYGDLIEQYEVTLSRMLNDVLTLDQQ